MPANALAEAGEAGGAGIAPEVGDTVEMTLQGRVSRTEGGELYIQPMTVNGQPLENGGMGDDAGGDNYDMAGEEAALRAMPAGAGALLALLLWLGLMVGGAGAADLQLAKRISTSAAPSTNSVFVNVPEAGRTNAMQVFQVVVPNISGSAGFALLFDSRTNKLVNASDLVAVRPVASGADVVIDFGPSGAPFQNGINVCLSTTPNTLTNAALGGYISVTWSPLY